MSPVEHTSEDFLTLGEVAQYLRLEEDHRDGISAVRYLIRSRQLRAAKVGKTWRIRKSWVDEFIAAASVEPVRIGSRSPEAR
jgi:excisionase family DNA binding protein